MGVTVRQKKPGKGNPWWVFINHQGQRKSMKIGDKETADKVARDIKRKLATGEYSLKTEQEEDKAPKFRTLAHDWLENDIRVLRRPGTYERYNQLLQSHILPVLGGKHIDTITRGSIKDFLLKKYKAGFSRSSVTLLRDVIGGVFQYAMDKEIVTENPVRGITKRLDLKRDRGKEVDPLTKEEEGAFLKACGEVALDYYAFFLMALRTGMRLGELLALKWGDIDFHSKYIIVRRSYKRGHFSEPKNHKWRRVDMSEQLIQVLQSYQRDEKTRALKEGWGELPELVFHRSGQVIEQNFIRRIFDRVLDKAGLRKIRMHDLRHTYASQLLSLGESVVYVKEQLGHHSIQLTVDTYGHWIPTEGKAGVNKLDDPAPDPHPIRTQKKNPAIS